MKMTWGWLLVGTAALMAAEKGPADAPLVLLVFGDFGSPQGARAKPVVEEFLKAYPGKVRLIFKHAPLSRATLAHEAALAAESQGKFWEMHDLLYGAAQQPSQYAQFARQLGLDVAKFEAALKEHRYLAAVERDLAEARALGLQNVPMFFLNGKVMVGAPAIGSLRRIANQELGLPVEVSAKGAPRRGPANAPITLIEFSDFQCGFCTRVLPAVQQLMKEYPNKIQWLFKHYPLDFHKEAPLAHEAALAAGAQDKFWPMHDLLFERKTLKRDALIGLAKELGLDVERFTKDLDSRKYRTAVEADSREGGELGVDGTPTFFVNGKMLVGAQPIAAFRKLVEAELKKKN
jgi:protein-disulfide isomerase